MAPASPSPRATPLPTPREAPVTRQTRLASARFGMNRVVSFNAAGKESPAEICRRRRRSVNVSSVITMPTQRYKLTLAYRGTRYHGWQKQPMLDSYRGDPPPPGEGIPTIQEVLARAIQSVVRHPINLV